MAQLRDSVVQGSLRVTDTLYTTNLNLANTTASYAVVTDANKNLTTENLTVSAPTASGNATAFITSVSQSATGKISASKATVPTASTSTAGIMKVGTGLGVSSGTVSVAYGTAASTALQGNQNLFTLNNSAKNAAANASIYAPTTGGTAGYVLGSAGGTNAPVWSNKGNGRIFYGTCATAAATAAKVVVCEQYDELRIGDIMIVTFTNTASIASTMSITNATTNPTVTTTAKDIKCQIVTTISNILAGYLIAARPYMFVYDGTYWVMMNVNRDSNTAYAIGYQNGKFILDNTTDGVGRALHRCKILLEKSNGQLTPVSIKDDTATTDETIYDDEFLINGGIFYYSAATLKNPGQDVPIGSLWTKYDLDLTYSFNTGATLIPGKPVYLKAKPTYIDSPYATLYKNETWSNMAINATTGKGAGCITQNIEDESSEFIYIKLGYAYNTTNITLSEEHPIYYIPRQHEIAPYSSIAIRPQHLYGISSLLSFQDNVIWIAKQYYTSGSFIIPIEFNASNFTSWSPSNMGSYNNTSGHYLGYIQLFKTVTSNNVLYSIGGNIIFQETPNSMQQAMSKIYHWQFYYREDSSASYSTWKYDLNNINTTLPVNGWSNTLPYTQTITINDMVYSSNTSEIIAGLDTNNIAQETYEQACEAQIVCTSYSTSGSNSIFTFTAFGEKPTIDIPISISISY